VGGLKDALPVRTVLESDRLRWFGGETYLPRRGSRVWGAKEREPGKKENNVDLQTKTRGSSKTGGGRREKREDDKVLLKNQN